jgi:hypothetical protein
VSGNCGFICVWKLWIYLCLETVDLFVSGNCGSKASLPNVIINMEVNCTTS